MTKMYSKEAIAKSIAAKLTKKDGQERVVLAVEGQFAIVLETEQETFLAEVAAQPATAPDLGATFDSQPVEHEEGTHEGVTEAPAPKVPGSQLMAMDVIGAWKSKGYVYTPELKGVKRKAKTRWFPADKVAVEPISGGLRLIAEAKVFTSRDIDISTAVPYSLDMGSEPDTSAEAQGDLPDDLPVHTPDAEVPIADLGQLLADDDSEADVPDFSALDEVAEEDAA